jgi:signal transduction histidine kinase
MKGMIAIALPLLSLLSVTAVTIVTDNRPNEANLLNTEITAIRASANEFLGALVDAETGVRGYALTHDRKFLDPMSALRRQENLARSIEQSHAAGRGGISPVQLRAAEDNALEGVSTMLAYVERKRDELRPASDAEFDRLLSEGKRRMDHFRQVVAQFEEDQAGYLRSNDRRLASMRATGNTVRWIAFGAGLGGCFLAIYVLQWGIVARIYVASAAARILPTGRSLPSMPESADEIGALMTGMQKASELLNERERDLTTRNRELVGALASVREASEHKSRFLANMSHELRTPLNAIIGFTEMVHDGVAGDVSEMQREFLGDSLSSATHLLNLIDGILDIEKLESGQLVLSPENFDLNVLITETLVEVQPIAASKDIDLASGLDSDHGSVFLDRRKTKQILLNLIMNAIKFTPLKGRVIARLRSAGHERVLVEIEDTGIAISVTDQLLLFREFVQLDTGPSRRFPGTGLGLFLTRRFAEAMGGAVSVSSQVGVGSTFSVMFPASGRNVHRH